MSGRIDPETGLPPLPQGCVWVVEPSPGGAGVWVSLVRGDKALGRGITAATADYVRQMADDILRRHYEYGDEQERIKSLCGTYPPGRLP